MTQGKIPDPDLEYIIHEAIRQRLADNEAEDRLNKTKDRMKQALDDGDTLEIVRLAREICGR